GSISQLDSSVATDEIGFGWEDGTDALAPDDSLLNVTGNRRQGLSVVSVDLHLVSYPSRRVVPGASVANSMVVRSMQRRSTASGIINLDDLGLSVRLDRIKSQGQAVRNLIELSLIELIGRHRGVPYWQCLSSIETDAKRSNLQEHAFTARTQKSALIELQRGLTQLDYYNGPVNGQNSAAMRRVIGKFQADEQLVVNGIADFDTLKRLRIRLAKRVPIGTDISAATDTAVQFKKTTNKPKQTARAGCALVDPEAYRPLTDVLRCKQSKSAD
ncbi:MAG: peptidoglycan-binding domain-containing protein, partial [Pseudomonadota bacterium]|nr:peptidoglycan-binding domain-containing protein [Pseudomonadota bacterium]